eukprot:TRINITY_DN25106_c0_g1_i1.p1 TRINITY_DN25106_c0_g1~~TRINITY_DN25106_c0_g1_i1.p1  ORF type:complete len:609 (+),score=88.46 TRINITY_DN25106_c0_g1_i1:68-1894(+)
MTKRSAEAINLDQGRDIKARTSGVLLHGGCILTCLPGHGLGSPVLKEYSWMLTRDGHIKMVGNGEPIKTDVDVLKIDLKGRLVLPGLFDSHCHVFYQGKMQQSLVLEGTGSVEELKAKLVKYHERHPDVQVIEGNQWDQELLGRFPTRHDLDVVPVPVILYRRCWHICCVNSAALRACNIKGDEVVEGGAVDVDEAGVATGLLREAAMDALLQSLKSSGNEQQHRKLLKQGMDVFLRLGCTSVLTNDGVQIGGIQKPWERYLELDRSGEMPLRVFLTIDWKELDAPTSSTATAKEMALPPWSQGNMQPGDPVPSPTSDGRLAVFRVKLWTDGALGASTAALEEPYSDDPAGKNRGILQISPELIRRAIGLASQRSFGVEAHTIGDRSARELLEAFEGHDVRHEHRYTMTHCQILNPYLVKRMANLGVVASIQPQFANSDAAIASSRLGENSERLRNSYAWKSMRSAGVRLAGGSDAPVEEPNPLLGMYRAMVNDIHSSENLTFAESLEMYTLGGAYAAFREKDLGALQEGFCADFVITSLRGGLKAACDPEEFRKARVDEVWVQGRREFQASERLRPPALARDGPGKCGIVFSVRGPCPCCKQLPSTA